MGSKQQTRQSQSDCLIIRIPAQPGLDALGAYKGLCGCHVRGLVLRRSRVVEAVAGPGAPPLATVDGCQEVLDSLLRLS